MPKLDSSRSNTRTGRDRACIETGGQIIRHHTLLPSFPGRRSLSSPSIEGYDGARSWRPNSGIPVAIKSHWTEIHRQRKTVKALVSPAQARPHWRSQQKQRREGECYHCHFRQDTGLYRLGPDVDCERTIDPSRMRLVMAWSFPSPRIRAAIPRRRWWFRRTGNLGKQAAEFAANLVTAHVRQRAFPRPGWRH
jgi:hypothetical protein